MSGFGDSDSEQSRRAFDPTGGNRVTEIPLFPLELVLFPYMILPLHIFEERYREMVNRCLTEGIPFGIVLVKQFEQGTGTVETHSVGCLARISGHERLEDGRFNIEVVGEERFRILDTHEERSYRSALVERLTDLPVDEEAIRPLAKTVQNLLKEFLLRFLEAMGQEISEFELPDDSEHLSHVAACVLPVNNEAKQAMLAEQDTVRRLESVRAVLIQEVERLRQVTKSETKELVWKRLETTDYDGYRISEN